MKKLTLEEIGKMAGVSRATVSRVINDHPNIRPEVRQRVQQVIRETGYQPNLAARSLASNRSSILGLVIPNIVPSLFSDPYFPMLIQGIAQACNASDYTLSLFLAHTRDETQKNLDRIVGTGLVDGLILTATHIDDPFVPGLLERDTPFVLVGRPHNETRVSFVDVDNVAGAYMAVSHLIRRGYKRIATIMAPLNTAVGLDRRAGYVNALKERGYTLCDDLVTEADFSFAGGYDAMQRLLPRNPDAVFAAADMMALGALQAMRDAGVSVPDDIGLVGFDDITAARTADPPLTTVRQPVEQNGRVAVETLIDMLNTNTATPRRIVLPTEFIIRSSCAEHVRS